MLQRGIFLSFYVVKRWAMVFTLTGFYFGAIGRHCLFDGFDLMKSLKALMLIALLLAGFGGAAWAQQRWSPSFGVSRSAFWADLGAQRSQQLAQAQWLRLQRKYPSLLGSARPWFEETKISDLGVFVRIAIGPFTSKQAASAVCHEFIRNGDSCMVKIRR